MAINLKAKETLQNVGDYKGNYRYVLGTEIYNRLSEQKVIQEAALRSGMSRGVMQAAWDAAGDVIRAWATEGHSVAIPGLGTMRLGVRAKSVATVNEVATGIITSRRVIFTPSTQIKRELADTSINITCYDRNGKIVKKVTSSDNGDVEDGDKTPGGGNTPSEVEAPQVVATPAVARATATLPLPQSLPAAARRKAATASWKRRRRRRNVEC